MKSRFPASGQAYRSRTGSTPAGTMRRAGVAEQADAADLNSAARKGVRVRTPAPAPSLYPHGTPQPTRTRSIVAAASSCIVGVTWEYTSRISAIVARRLFVGVVKPVPCFAEPDRAQAI